MITTRKSNYIEINGIIEWVLFYRLTKKVSPIDFLTLTDSLIFLPNFLYFISLLACLLFGLSLGITIAISSGFYFLGKVLVTFRFGIMFIKLIYYPLWFISGLDLLIFIIAFIICLFVVGWWTFLLIPIYFITDILSLLILTSKEKKYYKTQWLKTISNNEVFKNNAFLLCYKYFATRHGLSKDFEVTEQELMDQVWMKAYTIMRDNWDEIKQYFGDNSRLSWEAYLHIDDNESKNKPQC